MKKTGKIAKLIALAASVLAVVMLLCACGVKTADEPADEPTDVPATEVPATQTPKVTEVPVTAEPATEGPSEPTAEPKPRPTELDPGTDIFFDCTEYGNVEFTPDPPGAVVFETLEQGTLFSSIAADPYAYYYLDTGDQVPVSEYKYLALKVKASKGDEVGRVRYATTTDGRGWALLTYNYLTPGEWEIVVLDLTAAEYMEETTLDGDLTMIRLDHYDSSANLPEDYCVLLESMALFDDLEKAQAYKGLYQWPEETGAPEATEVPAD